MVLHIAYQQILTHALKDIKSSTFEYFYMENSPKADEILLEEPQKGYPLANLELDLAEFRLLLGSFSCKKLKSRLLYIF